MPNMMRERRSTQTDCLKKLSQCNPFGNSNRILFVTDTLLHYWKVVSAPFKHNVLWDIPVTPFNGSTFQENNMNVQTVEDAVSTRNALLQNTAVAAEEFIMYASRIDTHNQIFERKFWWRRMQRKWNLSETVGKKKGKLYHGCVVGETLDRDALS